MALGSESDAGKVGPKWEVGPAEDVVQALMETLVDPLLPLRFSNVPSSEDVQKAVAKQMHAVVLLYNYYHRKQKPELLFLDFVCFCKLAMVIRPPLIVFMKVMKESKPMELKGAEDQLSVTEKAIKDACDIAVALDASKDAPNIKEWPISKLAVLLIDSKRKHCMLQFGATTKGAWSLTEKDLDVSSINPQTLAKKSGSKRKRNNQEILDYDTEILQLAYDAVKNVTGVNNSDLEVLESHVTYSLSEEKSATRFYMMQCPGLINVNEQVPLKFLVNSLQGPLAEKLDYGSWKTTSVVEFHPLLPYVEFISCWVSGMDLCLPNNCNTLSFRNGCGEEFSGSRISALIVSKNNGNDSNQINCDSPRMEVDTFDMIASENCGTTKDGNDSEQPHKASLSGPSRVHSQTDAIVDSAMEELKKGCDSADHVMNEASRIDDDLSATEKFNEKHVAHSDKDTLSGSSRGLNTINLSGLNNIGMKGEDASRVLHSEIKVYHHRRKTLSSVHNDAQLQENGSSLNFKEVSGYTQHKDEKVSRDNIDVTNTSNRNGIAKTEGQLALFEATTNCSVEEQTASTSDQLLNALALLYRKRQELYSRICSMEDTLALCEDNIARIRDGGEVELARECIRSVISGNYHLLLEHREQDEDKGNQQGENNGKSQHEYQAQLSEIYLPGKSSCQDLEYACLKNNWRLPRYLTKSSDGKFLSIVVVEGKDFKLHAKGSYETKPGEARDSAAAEMIVVIRNTS